MSQEPKTAQPLTIYVVQDPPPSLLKEIKSALAAEGQEAAYPRNRNTFWFEQAHQHLKTSGQNYELVIPYQLPKDATEATVPKVLQDIGKTHKIHWVPVPFDAVEGHVRMDNDGWKAGFHGLEYGAPFSKKDYQGSLTFSEVMAKAVADRVEAGHAATGATVGVNIQNRYMCLVPGFLRDEMGQRSGTDKYVSTYFSHIDQTHRIDIFVKTPEIKGVVGSLLQADAVNFHTPRYAQNFMQAAERLFPGQVQADYDALTLKHNIGGQGERTVQTGSHFLGIDVPRWQRLVTEPESWDHAKKFLDQAQGRKILFAYDRCDPIKALDDRVEIYGKFLERNPDVAGKVVLMQAYYLANDTPREYADVYSNLFQRTNDRVNDINARSGFERAPIINLPKVSEKEIAGLIIAASVSGGTHVVSSQAEGLHMGMLESFAGNARLSLTEPDKFKQLAQQHGVALNKDSGPLSFWTSEVAGVVHYVKSTVVPMNPHDQDRSATTLREAVTMSPADRVARIAASYDYIRDNTSASWIDGMAVEMARLRQAQDASGGVAQRPAVAARVAQRPKSGYGS
jgi:trehalose-6-phosphate synthase